MRKFHINITYKLITVSYSLESFRHGVIGCHHFSNPLVKAENVNIAVGAVQLADALSHQLFFGIKASSIFI